MIRERELRMYYFVMYNLAEIQKGIQAGHCAVEYGQKYKNDFTYNEFAANFKTFILLDGGTSNNGLVLKQVGTGHNTLNEDMYYFLLDETKLGTMELHEKYLIENKIDYAAFHEPDANNALTALCFLCDEKIFDFENYPSFEKWAVTKKSLDFDEANLLREGTPPYYDKHNSTMNKLYKRWVRFVGGEKNAAIKQLIYGKKLA